MFTRKITIKNKGIVLFSSQIKLLWTHDFLLVCMYKYTYIRAYEYTVET